jgi:hypothetical protein
MAFSALLVKLAAKANLRIKDETADLTMGCESQVFLSSQSCLRNHVHNNMFSLGYSGMFSDKAKTARLYTRPKLLQEMNFVLL